MEKWGERIREREACQRAASLVIHLSLQNVGNTHTPTCFGVSGDEDIIWPGLEVSYVLPVVSEMVDHGDSMEVKEFWSRWQLHLLQQHSPPLIREISGRVTIINYSLIFLLHSSIFSRWQEIPFSTYNSLPVPLSKDKVQKMIDCIQSWWLCKVQLADYDHKVLSAFVKIKLLP